MLAAANLLMHTAHMSGREQISRLFDMITDNSAVTMGVRDRYGVTPGAPADFVILDAPDEFEALRLQSECLFVVRGGTVVCETAPAKRRLRRSGAVREVDFKLPAR